MLDLRSIARVTPLQFDSTPFKAFLLPTTLFVIFTVVIHLSSERDELERNFNFVA